MITIKTEKHTYTAKMGAEESEKLFMGRKEPKKRHFCLLYTLPVR